MINICLPGLPSSPDNGASLNKGAKGYYRQYGKAAMSVPDDVQVESLDDGKRLTPSQFDRGLCFTWHSANREP